MTRKKPPRRSGRQPKRPRDTRHVEVRITRPAVADLLRLAKRHHEAVRWVLTKMLLLERNPYAGAPLGHSLVGFRKLVVGDRAWRIIWRVQELDNGHTIIDIAEVWAVGTRSDDEVYNEMVRRVQSLDTTRPESVALAEIVKALVNARSLPAVVETVDPVPTWLADRLVKTAGLDGSAVAQMSLQQAVDAWTAIVSRNLGGGEG